MADVSSSAAKEHVLKGSGDIQRISGDAVQAARDLAHQYLAKLGQAAGEEARKEGRKTIMPADLQTAARALATAASAEPPVQG